MKYKYRRGKIKEKKLPVSKTIQNMLNEGIDTFVEIGPRKNSIRFCKEKYERQRRENIKY